jgi:hypothetical protein
MPKVSNKRKVIEEVCKIAEVDILLAPEGKTGQILDDAIEDVLTVSSFRYAIVRQPVPKSDQWYHNVLPSLDDYRFKQFLRVSRRDFGRIMRLIENNPVFAPTNNQRQLSIDKQLAITLYKFGFDGTGSSLVNTAALFGIGDGGSVMKVVTRVIQVSYNSKERTY